MVNTVKDEGKTNSQHIHCVHLFDLCNSCCCTYYIIVKSLNVLLGLRIIINCLNYVVLTFTPLSMLERVSLMFTHIGSIVKTG